MKEYRLENSPIVYYMSDNGSKSCLLFLHAAFANHNMFKEQFEYFGQQYSIIAPDIIGHGSSLDTKKGDSIGKMSQWIYEILQKHEIDSVHIVGVSLGSVLAQDFANKYPQCIKSLACFGGYDINNFDPKSQKENGSAQLLMMFRALVSVKWFAEENKKISAYTAKAQEEFYEMNICFPKKSFMYLAGINSMVNTCKTQPRAYPLLIGCGELDIGAEHAALKSWKAAEPEAFMLVLEGAGHCVNMDRPDLFNKTLHDWLRAGDC